MPTTQTPHRDELVARAAALVPLLRANAARADEQRRLPPEVIEALTDAGVFRLRVPARYGGYEADTRTLLDVTTALGRGDGSAAWVAQVYSIPGWMTGMFPDTVQDEVFATPDARVCGTLSPSGTARPAPGGIVVDGRWGFISGAHHAHWQVTISVLMPEDGEPYPVMALVPMSDLKTVDDWYASGLKGTGSITTLARDLFVPAERVVPLPAVLQGRPTSVTSARLPMYRTPLLPVATASTAGTLLGLAKAAREVFIERLPHRKITYTGYESQRTAPVTHLQVADATQKIDQAEFHALRLTGTVDTKAADGAPWKLEERARARADVGTICSLAQSAVETFAAASGGSSVYRDVPIQRIANDLRAAALHALINPATNAELYGRVLCGLEPDTPYI
ncbi:acyl-CoA dehydrogenase family protein [Streptomyces sp. NBC_01754]|uniref:acyl-CoA dehydrogenase family protein n=1 Tax=Streptomyces sp. NBC_01754 TaxID=2975930 RepID=UPI002DD7E8D3|nr:acyl-CoA dehydrogenase family protein [Streptomyces sp. NBC_01754]WSC90914.1 acyl-CoA dehydrogenase family protein [Streptomyces sp. NBC_01754]WSC96592.1 acyl-CoA dehydrogenase family protein [Streptomyces sp. NBC_01754]